MHSSGRSPKKADSSFAVAATGMIERVHISRIVLIWKRRFTTLHSVFVCVLPHRYLADYPADSEQLHTRQELWSTRAACREHSPWLLQRVCLVAALRLKKARQS